MGAWGTGNWQNDEALDWAAELREETEVEDALSVVLSEAGWRSVSACCRGLAAAETVAALAGCSGLHIPASVAAWIGSQTQRPSPKLMRMALEAVSRIEAQSELQELFDEDGRNEEWRSELLSISSRLKAAMAL